MMTTNKKYNKILFISFLVFLFIYNFTNIFVWWPMLVDSGHLIFNWPDSTANYFFADLFARTNQLWSFDSLNLFTNNLLHARSINVIEGNLVPITFLPAIMIFGAAWRILGEFGILAFTPILAALSGLLIYRLVYYIFKDLELSLISAVLFWSLAPVVFFANVVMLPNILFIFLLLAGFWAIAKGVFFDKHLYWILGSLFLSMAVFVRPTEIVWLAMIFIFILYFNRHKIYLKHYVYSFLIFGASAFLFLSLNKATYGAYFSTGYLNYQSTGVSIVQNSNNLLDYLKLLLIPFGFDFVLILKNFYKYFILIFTPHFILTITGVAILFYKKKINSIWKKYLILTLLIFILILIYYASWDIADPLVKELNSISISYVRYFLPLYILILPLVALAIKQIFSGGTKVDKLAYYVVIIALILSSLKFAFYSNNDGLLANKETIKNYNIQYQIVTNIIEDDAIIITERSDKLFFPKYRVIVPQEDLELWPRVKNIIDYAPIYYYTSKSATEISVDQKLVNELNLDLIDMGQIWHNFKLYKVISN